MLTKTTWFAILFFYSLHLVSQKNTEPPCNTTNNIVVDGSLSEWGSLINKQFSENMEAFYAVAIDSNNIFLAVKFNTDMQQMKILMAGMELYLDPKAKKNTRQAIYYPLPETSFQPAISSENTGRDPKDRTKRLKQIIEKKDMLKLQGFGSGSDGMYPVKNQYVHVSLGLDSIGCLLYEISINKKLFSGFSYLQKFSVGLKINALNKPDMGSMGSSQMPPPDGMGGGPPMGGGGPPMGGGGPPMGGGMPNMGEMEKLYETNKEWIKSKWCY